jgi:hypothetical protein
MAPADNANARAERAAKSVVAAATAWFALAVCWGLFMRVGGGHEAQIATRAIVAENMRVWHILAPVKDYTLERPTPDLYYVHHPWGMFWAVAAIAEVLGRGAWVPRVAAVLCSVSTPLLLYGIGRALWGPIPGALSALAYVVLPITLAFGNNPGFEVPVIFTCLLATWGYLRFAQRWRRRWMLVSLAGVVAAANSDWEADVFVGVVLVALAVGALMLPRWFGRVNLRRFAQWWVLAALLAGGTVVAYLAYFQHIDAIENLLHAEAQRARGDDVPLAVVLGYRRYWIDVTFTPVAVTVGKIALPIFALRVLLWRRIHEIFPLAILAMAVVEYVHFKNGADVHIYWPLPFAPYWALSVGVLGAVVIGVARRVLAWRKKADERGIVPLVALAVVGLVPLVVLPDGIEGLCYAKATCGRFNEKGGRIFNDVDMSVAMEWMAARMAPHTVVQMPEAALKAREHRGQEWALHRPIKSIPSTPYYGGASEERYYIGDLRFLGEAEQRRIADTFHAVIVGPFVFVDRQAPKAPVDAYSFDEREPTLLEWYLSNPTEPIRTVRPDPWLTWEYREHYRQQPNPPPPDAPRTLEEIRVAHNVAVARGDAAAAEAWKARLLAGIDTAVAARFTDGTQLLGKRFRPGVDPQLDLYFLAAGPLGGEYLFEVVSVIDAPRFLSLVPPDDRIKKYGAPFLLSPRLWQSGFIYVEHVDIRHRPGLERFAGYFDVPPNTAGVPPKVIGGNGEEVLLMTLK